MMANETIDKNLENQMIAKVPGRGLLRTFQG